MVVGSPSRFQVAARLRGKPDTNQAKLAALLATFCRNSSLKASFFPKATNAFVRCSEPGRLQHIADDLSPADLEVPIQRAVPAWPFRGYRFPPEIITHAAVRPLRTQPPRCRGVARQAGDPGQLTHFASLVSLGRPVAGIRASSAPRAGGDRWFHGRAGADDEQASVPVVAPSISTRASSTSWSTVDAAGHAAERFLHRVLDAEDSAEPRVLVTDKLATHVPLINHALLTLSIGATRG